MSEREDREIIDRVAVPLRAPEPAEDMFEERLMSRARKAVARGEVAWRQPLGVPAGRTSGAWLTRPRHVHVSPLFGLAAAAVFAAVIVGATLAVSRGRAPAQVAAAAPARQEFVRFVLVMPAARSVALVGDFNGWNPASTPLVRDTAGRTWTVSMPLTAGTYQYAFVVDGQVWLADPTAPLALKDEFGAPSSVVTVGGSRT